MDNEKKIAGLYIRVSTEEHEKDLVYQNKKND
jgi:hypothetical protein